MKDLVGSGSEEDDESIDMLAQARELDPETVKAREREFEKETNRRVLQELPAGSSAATVDGELLYVLLHASVFEVSGIGLSVVLIVYRREYPGPCCILCILQLYRRLVGDFDSSPKDL